MYQETMTQGLAYVDVLNSQAVNNASVQSAIAIDMQKFKRALYIISMSASTAGTGSLAAVIVGSANSNLTTNSNVTGTSITNLAANNVATTLEIRADQLTAFNSTYRYIKLWVTGSVNSVTVSAIGLGGEAVQKSGGVNYDLNTTYLTPGTVCSI